MTRRKRKKIPLIFRINDALIAILTPFAKAQKRREQASLLEKKKRNMDIDYENKKMDIALKEARLAKLEADTAKQWNSVTLQDATIEELHAALDRKRKDQEYMNRNTNP